MRYRWAMIALVVVLAPVARADGPGTTVVVLPWTASKDLELYEEPVAKAMVARLRQRTTLAYRMATGRSAPEGAQLIVDGRIVADADMVRLEARIRDPERGLAMATATTRRAPLAELESLADELAREIAPALERAARQKRSVARPEPAGADVVAPAATEKTMLVVRAAGRAAAGAVEVAEPATQATIEMVRRLGYRPVLLEQKGLLGAAQARVLLRSHRAPYVISFHVERVDFDWRRGVLTARGAVRITVFDRRGIAVMDRWLSTDTLVGSRGDRHAALVYFVAEQAALIAEPLLEKRLP